MKTEKSESVLLIYMLNVMNIRNLKQVLNDGLILKKFHRVIKFNQKAWLKLYINLKKSKKRKMWENRNIKLVTTERRRNCLILEPNYHTKKFFMKKLLAIEMRKTQILMNKPVYLGVKLYCKNFGIIM